MLIDHHAKPVSEDQLREEQRFVAVGKELEPDSPDSLLFPIPLRHLAKASTLGIALLALMLALCWQRVGRVVLRY